MAAVNLDREKFEFFGLTVRAVIQARKQGILGKTIGVSPRPYQGEAEGSGIFVVIRAPPPPYFLVLNYYKICKVMQGDWFTFNSTSKAGFS